MLAQEMLSGCHPFDPDGDLCEDGLKERIRVAPLELTHAPWDDISCDAKQIVQSLLRRDPSARPTATQLLSHPWVQSTAPAVPLRLSASRLASSHAWLTRRTTMRLHIDGKRAHYPSLQSCIV